MLKRAIVGSMIRSLGEKNVSIFHNKGPWLVDVMERGKSPGRYVFSLAREHATFDSFRRVRVFKIR